VQTLLIATTNAGKLREIVPILAGLPIDLLTLGARTEWQTIAPPEETGETFADNARLKAEYYAQATGLVTVAEDSGLEIDALDRAPGVESARFGGTEASYPEKFRLIYDALRQRRVREIHARFVCAIAVVRPSSPHSRSAVIFEASGTIEGRIAQEPKGSGGFGYDPIFYYPPFGCTLAEAGARKSTVSHRGQAFRALRRFLEASPQPFSP